MRKTRVELGLKQQKKVLEKTNASLIFVQVLLEINQLNSKLVFDLIFEVGAEFLIYQLDFD